MFLSAKMCFKEKRDTTNIAVSLYHIDSDFKGYFCMLTASAVKYNDYSWAQND